MSGPGGPASPSVVMTPQAPAPQLDARAIGQIKANIGSMIDQGAPESDITAYLAHEGVTVEELQNSPAAGPGQGANATTVSAYDPSISQRAADLATATRTGSRAPQLPDKASPFLRAMDWLNALNPSAATVARGMTGGTFDEAAGAGQAAGAALLGQPAGPAFKAGADATNANIANFKSDHPVLGPVLEGAGMVTSPLFRLGSEWAMNPAPATSAVGRFVNAPNMAGRALRAAGLGAGYGAETGAAYNQGDIPDRLTAALWGAGIGGTTAGIAAPAVESVTGAAQTFMDTLNARRAAANDPARQAQNLIATAIARDRMSPIPAPGEALASAGGPNMQALARQATVAPGTARTQAADYYAGAAADAPEVIGRSVDANVAAKRLLPTIEDLSKQQQTVASPIYKDAFAANQSMASPELDKILNTPEGKTALRKAATMMLNDRSRIGIPDAELTATVRDLVNAGKMKAPSTGAGVAAGLKLRGLDYVKRALDSRYETLISAGNKTEAGIILGLKKDLVKELDRLDTTAAAGPNSTVAAGGKYAQARAAFAEPAALKKAADWGSKVLTSAGFTDQKLALFNNLSPSEQAAARVGLAQAIIEKAGRMGPNTDPVNLFLKGKNANDLMRAMLPDQESFDSFVRTLQTQSRIVKSARTVMGGSPTSRIDAEKADVLDQQLQTARDAWNLATGSGVSGRIGSGINIIKRGWDKAHNLQRGVNEPVADQLGRALFNPDAAANLATVRNLNSSLVPQQTALTAHQEALRKLLGSYSTLPAAPIGAAVGSY